MDSDLIVIWDLDDEPDGNVAHIAEHDLTKEEVESVLLDPSVVVTESLSSGRPAAFGWTDSGRYIFVTWEPVDDDPPTIYPVTAYEVPPPGGS
jgi:uncharacterized DUF497 family protein